MYRITYKGIRLVVDGQFYINVSEVMNQGSCPDYFESTAIFTEDGKVDIKAIISISDIKTIEDIVVRAY